NYVTQDTAEATRPYMESYRAAWRETDGDKKLPKLGLLRFIVVADSDEAAEKLARRAYPKWHAHYDHLYRKHGLYHERGAKTESFEVTFDQGVRGNSRSSRAANLFSAGGPRRAACGHPRMGRAPTALHHRMRSPRASRAP